MKQTEALEILKSGVNVFLTGEPGAGKSYTINLFNEWAKRNMSMYPSITASTGIAATHINGVTIHSWSGIGIKEVIHASDLNAIMRKDYLVRRIASAEVLIIDEISMINGETLDNVDRVCRYVRGQAVQPSLEEKPFGGIQVIFVGDFFQLPPVSKKKRKEKFAFESDAWLNAKPKICYLTEQHRQEDQQYLQILTAMRGGKLTKDQIAHLKARKKYIPQGITRLFTHNADVDQMNADELRKIPGEIKNFRMTSYVQNSAFEFMLENLKKSCLSPEVLQLKVGAPVMFTRNDSQGGEYVNGTLGFVTGFGSSGMPIVKTKEGRVIYVEKTQKWSIEDHGQEKASISQVPLRLAWAITVHKCQGMSLDNAAMDLGKAFEYGQGYVALSRVRSLNGLYLEAFNERALEMHPTVVKMDGMFRKLSD